ncbi:mammalian cell entry protein [Mycobacterium alsense]|uniref:MCE family protein n=1 Tax=Mycobacterium alsense TaxID=324058 RepID=A0AA42BY78_9MYCO|nr:MlaD family protein [Mycobacterium alsense]MCV7379330.1 MCE family protein [Mycobacterium alsense]OQZ92466.1 mammalian cell entry protein [Mycobacterium alsense]
MGLRDRLASLGKRRAVLDEHAAAIRSRRQGILGVVVIAAALAGTAMAYLNPSGQTGYTAHLSNSGGVRAGDQVRVAGIPVGKVTGVRLAGGVVELQFDVEQSVKVGSESTLDVKLLTPLGGHYVALDPKGALPLGRNVIPPQRVTLPFEVNDIIQAATPLIKEVDGQVIHDTFTEVANAANKYPNAVRDLLRSANALTTSLSESTEDFHRTLDFTNNGLRAMVAGRKQLITLFEQLDILSRTYTAKSVDIVEFFSLLGELSRILDRIAVFYAREVAPVGNGIDDITDTLTAHPDRIGEALEGLGQALNIVVPMLSGNGVLVDQHNRLVPGQDLCLPNLMRHC